jgi:hypothetical protein
MASNHLADQSVPILPNSRGRHSVLMGNQEGPDSLFSATQEIGKKRNQQYLHRIIYPHKLILIKVVLSIIFFMLIRVKEEILHRRLFVIYQVFLQLNQVFLCPWLF